VKAAIDNKVPMVVHIGAPWCVPCKQMENNVWPGVEKDLKGKAAFVHMNGDEILNEGKGGASHKALTKGVESFPTIKVVEPFYKDGKLQFNTIAEHAGGMSDTQVREMLRKAKVGVSGDAAK
jgi:thioredoxin-like negative regulator of GroEL